MKKGYALLLLAVSMFTLGCKQEQTPKVIYSDKVVEKESEPSQVEVNEEVKADYLITDLPISFGDSNYLIHPVGQVRTYGTGSKYSSKKQSYSFTISSYVPFQLTGSLDNLMFQHIDSLSIYPLTQEIIKIETVNYLKELADKTKKHILVYTLSDRDTNLDGQIDRSDIKSLYISDNKGKNFTKLNPELQEVLDWSLVIQNNRLYFRCIQDVNKNGAFDKTDTIHYYYVDLLQTPWQTVSYTPFQDKLKQEEVEIQ